VRFDLNKHKTLTSIPFWDWQTFFKS